MTSKSKICYPDPTSKFVFEIFVRCPSYKKSSVLIKCQSSPHKTKKDVYFRFADNAMEKRIQRNVLDEVQEALRDYCFPNSENLICV